MRIKPESCEVEDAAAPAAAAPANAPVGAIPEGTVLGDGKIDIAFARIDTRLLHGQVATTVTKMVNPDRIIVCSDDVAKDDLRKSMIEQAAPGSITVNQLQFGLGHTALIDEGICVNTTFDQGIVRTGSVLDYCQLKKIEIQAWSPLQYGFFEGTIFSNSKYQPLVQKLESIGAEQHVSAPAVAIAWIMRHPAHIVPVLGSMNIQHLDELYEAVNVQIDRKTWYELYQLAGNPLP